MNEIASTGVLMEVFFGVIIVIAVVIAFQLAPNLGYSVESANSIPGTNPARATITFTAGSNVSCGEYLNLTNVNGVTGGPGKGVNVVFNITTGCPPMGNLDANQTVINLTLGGNSTRFASSNLTVVLNANSTFSTSMTATNGSDGNSTVLTYKTAGETGNLVGVAGSIANATIPTNATGGSVGSNWNSTTNANIVTGVSIWSSSGGMLKATVTIGVAAIALLALFGIFARRRGGGGGGGGGL